MGFDLHTAQPTRRWAALLNEGVLPSPVATELACALVHHLADFGILQCAGADLWRAAPQAMVESGDAGLSFFIEYLGNQASTDDGFLLACFLNVSVATGDGVEVTKKDENGSAPEAVLGNIRKPVSDLSNLQIVKKIGRQLEPFLDMEKRFFAQVEGKYTSKEEARLLFNFYLERTRTKEKPRAWEQLSRRKHK